MVYKCLSVCKSDHIINNQACYGIHIMPFLYVTYKVEFDIRVAHNIVCPTILLIQKFTICADSVALPSIQQGRGGMFCVVQ